MPRKPKFEPHWEPSRNRWLIVGPRPERKHWYFENRSDARAKQRELLAGSMADSVSVQTDLARSAIHWDEEFRDYGFSGGLEEACHTFAEQLRILISRHQAQQATR